MNEDISDRKFRPHASKKHFGNSKSISIKEQYDHERDSKSFEKFGFEQFEKLMDHPALLRFKGFLRW